MEKPSCSSTEVFRSVLTSGIQFEEYVNRIGRPRFAISYAGDNPGAAGTRLAPDVWLFANNIERLMMAVFDWDARGIRMEFDQPSSDEPQVSASWMVVGLPKYFNDAASHLSAARLGPRCKTMAADGARQAFLESVFNGASAYDFIALRAERYESFIEDWKADDEKDARPEHYPTEKRFGVIVDADGASIGGQSTQYWVSIGWTSGRLDEHQLRKVGLTCCTLIGQTCVINRLGEVERIGRFSVARKRGA